jgi:glucose-6-phosphate 1-dehydrogenase
MSTGLPAESTVLVIFGAGGDLTWRKLVPALHALQIHRALPERFAVFGLDRKGRRVEEWRERLRAGVEQFSQRGRPTPESWNSLAERMTLQKADFASPECYQALAERIAALEAEWGTPSVRIFYLAVPPIAVETIVRRLQAANLCHGGSATRIVVEKPFGRDLASARALDSLLRSAFDESQIFRIDHYLGKETVQNLLAFRFANALFEPIWNRRYIEQVQVTVAETVGIGHRGRYFEHAGALRDMVQNHLLQLVCLLAMEPPVSFDAQEIRNRKVDVLHTIRPIPPGEVHRFAVRGQYGAGWIEGERVPGYREERDVDPTSGVETYAALKLYVDNWRWQGVPFYLRTGKRLPARVSEASIVFRPVPHQAFPSSALTDWRPNRLVLRIQPDESITLRFQAKLPGLTMRLSPVQMHFSYREGFKASPPDAYETLLRDVMLGDATLFMRADQVEAAWAVVAPVLEYWEQLEALDFPNYPAGIWGPETAQGLIAQDGGSWLLPTGLPWQGRGG